MNWSDRQYCLGRGVAGLRPKNGSLDGRYLWRWLSFARPELEKRGRGSTFRQVSRQDIAELAIVLPDNIDEQHRIAAILDKADAIHSRREQALAMADKLLQSAFLQMFGDPVLNTKALPLVALGDLIKVSSGNGLTAKNMDPSGKYPVYGGNGVNGFHSEYMFEEPQIVIGRVGVYCGAIHVTRPKSWVTDNALYIREYKKPVDLTFLEWALRFANFNQYAGRSAQPLISGSRIYPIEIVFPHEKEQAAFADYAKQKEKQVSLLNADLAQARDLFSSLSQRAFRGEL